MKKLFSVIPFLLFCLLSLVFIYPIFQGLILLPLDLLVSNYSPWHFAGTILLKNPFMQDSIMQLFPWRHLTYEALRSGMIPFWNPYQFMGMPFMAGMKPMVFYPLNLFFGLGETTSWHLLLVFQLVGAGFFMYMLVRELTKNTAAAMLSGISFAYSSLMVGLLEFGSDGNAIIWLPLFLYAAKKYFDTKKGIYLPMLGVSIACAVFAGHLQYVGYELIVTCVFILIYGMKVHAKIASYIHLALAGIFGFGISAIQILPSLEMFTHSYRGIADSYSVFADGLLKPFQLVRLLAPDFFGHPATRDLTMGYIEQCGYFGIVPLFFTVYAGVTNRKNWFIRFFSVLFIVGVLFSLDGVAQILYILKIPLVTSGYGARIFYTALFSGSVLAGFGLSSFVTAGEEAKKRKWVIGYVLTVLGIFGIAFILTKVLHTPAPSLTNLKFPVAIIVLFAGSFISYAFAKKIHSNIVTALFIVAVLGITYVDLFRLGYRFLTFSNNKFLYPNTKVVSFVKEYTKDTLGRVYGLVEPELPTYLGVQSVETYNSFYSMRTAILLATLDGKEQKPFPVNKYLLNKNENLKHILDFAGTSLIVIGKGKNPASEYFLSSRFERDLTKVYEDEQFDVYKNNTVRPRFGLYYDIKQSVGDIDALRLLKDNVVDTSKTLIIDETLPAGVEAGTGSAKLTASTVNSQVFNVTTDKQAMFYLSDSYYPGWTATVNGVDAHIYRANYNFRGVLVPSGISDIVFRYEPTHWGMYVGISVLSIVFLVLMALV